METSVRAFLDHLAVEKGASPNTVAAYRNDLSQLLEHFAGPSRDGDRLTLTPPGRSLASRHPTGHALSENDANRAKRGAGRAGASVVTWVTAGNFL